MGFLMKYTFSNRFIFNLLTYIFLSVCSVQGFMVEGNSPHYYLASSFFGSQSVPPLVYHEEIIERNHLKEVTELMFNAIKADRDTLRRTTENMLLHTELYFDNNDGPFGNYFE